MQGPIKPGDTVEFVVCSPDADITSIAADQYYRNSSVQTNPTLTITPTPGAGVRRCVVTYVVSGGWSVGDRVSLTILINGTDKVPAHDTIRLVSARPDSIAGAPAGASGGHMINGVNAGAVTFGDGVTISNANGHALQLTSSGANGIGLSITGNGTGQAILLTPGATADAVLKVAGTGSVRGIYVTTASGDGIVVTPSTLGNGLVLSGAGAGRCGISTSGGTGGHGIQATAGSGGKAFKLDGSDLLTLLGTPAGASISADIAAVYGIVNHASYGNAQLVRSATPANALTINASGQVTVGSLANAAITAASIAASALNGKGDWLLDSGYTAPDNATIGALNALATGANGFAAIKADTAVVLTTIGSPAGASVSVDLGNVKSVTDAIKALTDRLAAMLDGGTPDKYTVAALSNAPAGGAGGGTTDIAVEFTEVRA